MKFRFRWFANGAKCDAVIEARDYPMACYRLSQFHVELWTKDGVFRLPEDFAIDLSKVERVNA